MAAVRRRARLVGRARSRLERLAAATRRSGSPGLVAESYGAGPKPVPGDGEPVLGPLPGTAGCWVAFTHSGATLGLVVGELLAAEILDGAPNPFLEPFRPDRFGGVRRAFRDDCHPPDTTPPIVTDR